MKSIVFVTFWLLQVDAASTWQWFLFYVIFNNFNQIYKTFEVFILLCNYKEYFWYINSLNKNYILIYSTDSFLNCYKLFQIR